MNNTTITTTTNSDDYYYDATEFYPNTVIAFRLYVIVGSCAVFVNCLIISVFLSTKNLRNRYQLLITLSIADAIDGIGLIISGVKRTQVIYNLILLYEQITVWQCAQQVYAVLAVIGAQWVAFINLCLSIERLTAVELPIWYKLHFNTIFRLKLAIFTGIITLISLAIGMLQSYLFFSQTQSFALCSLSLSFGDVYAAWVYSVTVFGNLIAVIINAYAYLSIRRKFAHIPGGVSNIGTGEYAHVRYVLAIACVTVCLISIPNVLLWMEDYSLLSLSQDDLGYVYVPFCCNAFINFFIYLLFNREFRIRFIYIFYYRLILFNRVDNVNQLTTAAAQTIHVQPLSKSAF